MSGACGAVTVDQAARAAAHGQALVPVRQESEDGSGRRLRRRPVRNRLGGAAAGEGADRRQLALDDWDGDGRSEVSVSAQYAEVGATYGAGTTSVWTGGTLYP